MEIAETVSVMIAPDELYYVNEFFSIPYLILSLSSRQTVRQFGISLETMTRRFVTRNSL